MAKALIIKTTESINRTYRVGIDDLEEILDLDGEKITLKEIAKFTIEEVLNVLSNCGINDYIDSEDCANEIVNSYELIED